MPVFGKSLFETVLDGMEPEEDPEDDAPVPARPRFAPAFVADTSFRDEDDTGPPGGLYETFAAPPPTGPAAPEPPAWLDRLSETDVIADLGLLPGMDGADIRERRRAFARENHPDRVPEQFREQATIRMTTANRLVEAALRRR